MPYISFGIGIYLLPLYNVVQQNGINDSDANETSEGKNIPLTAKFKQTLTDLWHQKPGVREKSLQKDMENLSTKQVVEGLSLQEMTFGLAAVILELAFTIIGWHVDRTSKQELYRRVADSLLIAGLVSTGILGLGLLVRRRALLGFGAFLTGMELISFGNVIGVVYLFFGGWLIVRAMRKQRQDKLLGNEAATIDRPFGRNKKTDYQDFTYKPPKPSKRYTPPRRRKKSTPSQ